MKVKKILSGLLVTSTMFAVTMPNVYAQTYVNGDNTKDNSNYSMDTTYESGTYVEQIETYNVELDWDDLHWVFIYDGNITNPTSSVWLTKTNYDSRRGGADVNDFNHTILSNIAQYKNLDTVGIDVTNKSVFAVNIAASIEQKNNVENYTNAAGLQVSKSNDLTYGNQATLSSLANNANGSFVVKPTATRFVNNTGTTANVTGEVKLTFTKSN